MASHRENQAPERRPTLGATPLGRPSGAWKSCWNRYLADAPGYIRSPLPGLKTRLTLELRKFKTGASGLYSRHLVPLDCKMVLEDLHELC